MYYFIALTLIPGIGPVNAKSLLSYCGSAEKIFKTKASQLLKIPGIGEATADAIIRQDVFARVDEEMLFLENRNIQCLTFMDDNFPKRLKNCVDSPIVLYYSGNTDLNTEKIIGIVGTRNATDYGKNICDKLIEDLQAENILIVSGLAYGIDIAAHKACVRNNVPTVGVLAHGLDRIYPYTHREMAGKMLKNGGLLTEFMSQTNPDRQNFPKRNRIVAGMIDALVVVETAENGGAVITASLADSYNKDVMAFPGNINYKYSKGCNNLIKTNRAALVENANDILEFMRWTKDEVKPKTQRTLFIEFTPEEKLIYEILLEKEEVGIDELTARVSLSPSAIAGNLLNLEFQGIINSLPGKRYKLI